MGLAKSAELNGYPGPSHVLALGSELGLDAEQQSLSKSLFIAMEDDASKYGRLLIDEERKLEQLFTTKQVTPEVLTASLEKNRLSASKSSGRSPGGSSCSNTHPLP